METRAEIIGGLAAARRLRARAIVWAAPNFVAQRAIPALREQSSGGTPPVYSPWVVANLTLDALPGGHGMDLTWDNVFYASKSLGYVVATHQNPHPVPRRTIVTYYQPLDEAEPAAEFILHRFAVPNDDGANRKAKPWV